MKKITFSFKSLLVAAGLLLGSANAWANILSPSAGNVDNSTAWNTWDEGFTQNYTMSGNSTASFTFHYTSDPTASDFAGWTMFIGKTINTTNVWDTWITCKGFDGGFYGADGLGGTRLSSNTYAGTLSAASCTEADVTVTITRTAENITAVAAVDPTSGAADYTITWTYTYGGSDVVNGDLYISFAVEKAYLNITNVTGPNVITTTQADINFTKDIADGAIAGVLNSISVVSGTTTATEWNSTNKSLKLGKSTSTVTIPAAIRAGSRDKVTISFDLAYGKLNNRSVFFNAKDASGNLIFDETYNVYSNSFSANTLGVSGDDFYHGFNTVIWDRRATYTIVIDYATNKINTSVKNNYGGGVVNHQVDLSNSNPVATFNVGSNYDSSPDRRCEVSNIKITTTLGDYSVTEVGYTVKFQDALGNTLKADVIHDNGVVGEVYQATAEDLATFYNGGETQKYVYKSGQNTSVVASSTASENVITLVFDVYDKTTYHVNAQAGGSDIKTDIATGSAFLDGSTTAYWSKYLKVGSQWYVADETTYGAAITAATTNVAYTATDAIDYFFEFEDMSDNSAMLGALSGTAISGGNSQRFNANGKKWTTALAGGTYTLNLYCNGNNGKSVTMPMYYSDPDGSNVVYIGEATACQASTWSLKTTNNVVIPEGKALCFYNNSSYTHNYIVDYVTLTKTADATVPVTVSAAGYATFSSAYALDLTTANTPAGLTAYYINSTELSPNNAPFTTIDQIVAAGEGILLKGDADTYNIKVAASGTPLPDNALVATNGSAIGVGNYVFAYENSTYANPGFYYVNAETAPVAAGKAYLNGSLVPNGVKAFIFDNTVTGIESAAVAEAEEDGVLYNTSGQQVTEDYKGIVIKNGKKYLNK